MKDKQSAQKDKIINAAMKVLYEQGLGEMTFRNVAAEAGISPGTLHYYYNSKDLILYDLLDQTSNKAAELVETLHDDTDDKDEVFIKMMHLMEEYVQNQKQNMIFLHLLHEAVSGNTELTDKIKEKYQNWFDSYEELIELYYGIPKGPQSKSIAIVMNAMVDGLAFMELLGIDTINQPDVKKVIAYLLLNWNGATD